MRSAIIAGLLASTAIPCSAADFRIEGDRIFVLGTIDANDELKFQAAIKDYKGPATVVLHSGGGYLNPARAIGVIIRRNGWTTHVELYCNSACTQIWLSGAKLTRTFHAQIGFHTSRDTTTGNVSPEGNMRSAEYLKSLGYSDEIAHFGLDSLGHYTFLTNFESRRLGLKYEVVPESIPASVFAGVDVYRRPDPGLDLDLAKALKAKAEQMSRAIKGE